MPSPTTPSPKHLDKTFGALADPTRRAIVARLGATSSGVESSLPVGTLAKPFDMSLPAILKHLRVLEDAGLVVRRKEGRTVYCRLDPAPLSDAMSWLEETERFWSGRLDALADVVEAATSSTSARKDKPKEGR